MATAGADLVGRMAAGDRQAFALFYDRHAPVVFPQILRIVRDRDDASDVLQEVFWEAWRDAGGFEASRGSPEAWMITRARTRAIDRIRATRRRSETFAAPLDDAVAVSALRRLPAVQREVIALAYYAALTQTEIADRIKQPLDAVKARIREGLERLRDVAKTGP